MQFASIAPAAITGVVGLAGIGASLLAARLTINAEDKRGYITEKRRIYAKFNAAIEDLWITATSSEDFSAEPGRSHYNQAMKSLSSSNYEVSLVASGKVSELSKELADAMINLAYKLRMGRSRRVPPGFEDEFDQKRGVLIALMRVDLGEKMTSNINSI